MAAPDRDIRRQNTGQEITGQEKTGPARPPARFTKCWVASLLQCAQNHQPQEQKRSADYNDADWSNKAHDKTSAFPNMAGSLTRQLGLRNQFLCCNATKSLRCIKFRHEPALALGSACGQSHAPGRPWPCHALRMRCIRSKNSCCRALRRIQNVGQISAPSCSEPVSPSSL